MLMLLFFGGWFLAGLYWPLAGCPATMLQNSSLTIKPIFDHLSNCLLALLNWLLAGPNWSIAETNLRWTINDKLMTILDQLMASLNWIVAILDQFKPAYEHVDQLMVS